MDYKVLTGKQERLNRLMNLHFSSFFDDLPLTSTQALTLEFIIDKAQHGEVFQKDIEVFLSIRGSSVTSLINNLERDGYIRRETVAFDGRYKHLAPTEKALGLKPVISERIDRYMESLFVGIPEEDLKIFESVLEKMAENAK
ncbi:MAG: MarR family transcriptional regulator [Lachnospiraceae bacterium]|nr:MarR family transcriptional regulator [Lachnospiraceae bacterium]MDY4968980.1 MarR family transcriptional regulator [Lachnospiraceae bacterium]